VTITLDENLPERLVAALIALITQDLDFSDARRYRPGTHAGLLLLRLAQPGREGLRARVTAIFSTEAVEKWRGCIVVATDHEIRIRRP
jgi:hypothetical protein